MGDDQKTLRRALRDVERNTADLESELTEGLPYQISHSRLLTYVRDLKAAVIELGVAIRGWPRVETVTSEPKPPPTKRKTKYRRPVRPNRYGFDERDR